MSVFNGSAVPVFVTVAGNPSVQVAPNTAQNFTAARDTAVFISTNALQSVSASTKAAPPNSVGLSLLYTATPVTLPSGAVAVLQTVPYVVPGNNDAKLMVFVTTAAPGSRPETAVPKPPTFPWGYIGLGVLGFVLLLCVIGIAVQRRKNNHSGKAISSAAAPVAAASAPVTVKAK